jgi:hypothetical protein
MEQWNDGMLEYWVSKAERTDSLFSSRKTHHSSIPLFQYSGWSETNFRMVEKMFLSCEEQPSV